MASRLVGRWQRKMSIVVKPFVAIAWIPDGQIVLQPKIFITIIALDKTSGDTLRKIANTENINSDTLRKINATENFRGNTNRQLKATETIRADTLRKSEVIEIFTGDTLRILREPSGNIIIKMWRNTPSFSYGDISRNKVSA